MIRSPFLALTALSAAALTVACAANSLDGNNDKVVDSLGQSLDLDNDGFADLYDINGDGEYDGIGIDTDGDGQLDSIGIDTDGDGILDALDADGDGEPDEAGTGGSIGTGGGDAGVTPGNPAPGAGGGDSGTGGSPSGGSGCSSADILCENFESIAPGMKPEGSPWEASTCNGGSYKAEVQAGAGVSGSQGYFSQSPGSASENTCALQYALGSELNDFWVTAHIKITGAAPSTEHEVTFFELGEVMGDDPELRIGYRGDSSCTSAGTTPDGTYPGFELGATRGTTSTGESGEATGCTGNVPLPDTWYCLEVHVVQDEASMTAGMSVDGEEQAYLMHGKPTDEVLGRFRANYLKVGMQSYSGNFDGLVMDDISVSTTRVGCGG